MGQQCPSIKVLDITDDGKYFVFASGNFEKMIEMDSWHDKVLKVHQEGSSSLDGKAFFWSTNSDGNAHFHGRWDDPAPEAKQWKKGDEIVLQSCNFGLKGCNYYYYHYYYYFTLAATNLFIRNLIYSFQGCMF